MLEPGALSLGLSVCGSVLALPTEAMASSAFVVYKLYFTHTKITVARVFFYFLDIIEVTAGSLVDGTEITQLI